MWLLNTNSLRLEFFQDDRDLVYAILSHRWREDEVLFQDVQRGDFEGKAGYTKLKQTCEIAKKHGYQYVWIDTCAIDKSSSAELSEAINSMYRWYQASGICYAYMFDVGGEDGGSFKDSAWFTRGWTLQELIAPRRIEFYDSSWQLLGTRETLQHDIAMVTGIPEAILAGTTDIEEYSIAQRMSWAAKRVTTRIEDIAYSLLGIFNVNMPMLYGEGEKAFLRLQEAIMVDSPDDSIFAWKLQLDDYYHGLLARSPADFADCGNIEMPVQPNAGFRKTNMGINFSVTAHHYAIDVYHVLLGCTRVLPSGEQETIGIFVGFPLNWRSGDGVVGRRTVQDSKFYSLAPFPPANGSDASQFVKQLNVPTRPFINRTIQPMFNGLFLQKFKLFLKGKDITQCVHIIVRPDTFNVPIPGAIQLPFGANGCVVGFAIREAVTAKAEEQDDAAPPIWMIAKLGFNRDWGPAAWVADMAKAVPTADIEYASPRVLTEKPLRDVSILAKATKELSVHESLSDGMILFGRERFLGSRVNGMDVNEDAANIRMWREMRPDLGGWAWIAELEIKVSNFAKNIKWPSAGAIAVAASTEKQKSRTSAHLLPKTDCRSG